MDAAHSDGPFVVGDSVVLRGLRDSDLTGNYFRWFDDGEVCQYNSHGRFPNTTERMQAFYRRVSTSQSDLVLAITLKSGGEHVGNVGLHGISWIDRSAEYAIIIGEKGAWGRGVGKEASALIVRHGFVELNLHRIYCGTSEDNLGMQRLAAFMGMKEEGRRRQAMFKHGKYRDVVEYGVLRDEFLARRVG